MRFAHLSRQGVVGIFALAIVVVTSMSFGMSAGDLDPAIGTKAPDIGKRLDQDGKTRTIAELYGRPLTLRLLHH